MTQKIFFPLLFLIFFLQIDSNAQNNKNKKKETVFIEYLTSQELIAKIETGFKTVLIFSGGTEASGPHIVLGKHNFRVNSYSKRIAESLENTLVAPILPFAPNGASLQKFAGTISLDSLTFSNVNEQVAISMISAGFKNIILMSDHGTSQIPLQSLAYKLDSVYRNQGMHVYFASDGYKMARTQIESYIETLKISPGGHGGLWDTSETLAISETLVRPHLFAIGDTTKRGNGPMDSHGVSGDPRKSSKKLGEMFADIRINLAVAEIRKYLKTLKQ